MFATCTSTKPFKIPLLPLSSQYVLLTHQLAVQTFDGCRSLEQAFKDLRGVMAKAADMVELAERFRLTMAAQQKQAQQGTGVSPALPGPSTMVQLLAQSLHSNQSSIAFCPVLIANTKSAAS